MKSIRQKRKEVGRKSLFRRFVYLYRLTVVNEDEQRRVFRMRISHFILTLFILIVAGLGAWGGIAVFTSLPKQKGTSLEDYRIRQTIVNDALRIDSLEQVFELQNQYITNLPESGYNWHEEKTVWAITTVIAKKNVNWSFKHNKLKISNANTYPGRLR
jgi:hypothetical protein